MIGSLDASYPSTPTEQSQGCRTGRVEAKIQADKRVAVSRLSKASLMQSQIAFYVYLHFNLIPLSSSGLFPYDCHVTSYVNAVCRVNSP